MRQIKCSTWLSIESQKGGKSWLRALCIYHLLWTLVHRSILRSSWQFSVQIMESEQTAETSATLSRSWYFPFDIGTYSCKHDWCYAGAIGTSSVINISLAQWVFGAANRTHWPSSKFKNSCQGIISWPPQIIQKYELLILSSNKCIFATWRIQESVIYLCE